MCGIAGYAGIDHDLPADRAILAAMTGRLSHRGPDSEGFWLGGSTGLAFRRLAIVDAASGRQPMLNEDGTIVLVCNGEIFNHAELREELEHKGHRFRSRCDVEPIVHLYEEFGPALLERLNGQFAFALYDSRCNSLLLARDHFGINPLHYTVRRGTLIFASEIKALLQHPDVSREVDLTGLDQILCFPGTVSPRTLFRGVSSLPAGHYLLLKDDMLREAEYWDLDYPREEDAPAPQPEEIYIQDLAGALSCSVGRRLQGEVPIGLYLSGGLDSSLVAAMARQRSPDRVRDSFSIAFADRGICEAKFQRETAAAVGSNHHEQRVGCSEIASRLARMVYHCETPVKETFNACSLALSEAAHNAGLRVVLAGEGADELFGGYPGYRFDRLGRRAAASHSWQEFEEEEVRERLWGDRSLMYEHPLAPLAEVKAALYSDAARESDPEFDCFLYPVVDGSRLAGRHVLHQRSYFDCKLRLADHLLSEHGDRTALAHSVEARYPFLDLEVFAVARRMPPDLKVRGLVEKYAVRKVAEGLVPDTIVSREKFGFRAPSSPALLQQGPEWIADLLSRDRIRRQGYFNPDTVERLRQKYSRPGAALHPHLETDLLMIVITFGLFLESFQMPSL